MDDYMYILTSQGTRFLACLGVIVLEPSVARQLVKVVAHN